MGMNGLRFALPCAPFVQQHSMTCIQPQHGHAVFCRAVILHEHSFCNIFFSIHHAVVAPSLPCCSHTYACWLHQAAIISARVSPSGHQLATIAGDGSVFFLSLVTSSSNTSIGLAPLVSCHVTGTPTSAAWSPDSSKLLIGCSSGAIVELQPPVENSDTSR